jgi:hypothetical protein
MTDRLRINRSVLADETQVRETRRALQQGLDLLAQEGEPTPSLRGVIWRLAQDAAETLERLPDREKGWLTSGERAIWPELARPSEECRAVEKEIANELAIEALRSRAGGLVYLRTLPDPLARLPITDTTAVDRMLTVLSWLRFVKGKGRRTIRRDQMCFLALALGRPPRVVRAQYLPRHSADATLRAIKGKVLLHLSLGLMPYSKQLTINGRSRNLR